MRSRFYSNREKKKVTKTYVPTDITEMIKEATHDKPFKTVEFDKTDFKDLHDISKQYLNTCSVQISKVTQIRVTRDVLQKGLVQTKSTHNEIEPWKDVRIFKKGVKFATLKNMHIPQLTSNHRISKEKNK